MATPRPKVGSPPSWCSGPIAFLITPVGRDTAGAEVAAEDARAVIYGYHWFTDWGRDTMISLEELDAPHRTAYRRRATIFADIRGRYVRDGLIPNMFPEGQHRGTIPHCRRHAVVLPRNSIVTCKSPGDHETLKLLLPVLRTIVDWRICEGNEIFGIGVDPADDLLRTRGPRAIKLTWMDAKVGDLGRDATCRGKAVRKSTRCGTTPSAASPNGPVVEGNEEEA